MLKKLSVLVTIIALVATIAVPALAETGATPNGPFPTETQNISLSAYHDYEQLVKRLKQLEQESNGEIKLEVVGQSREGRNIYMIKAGHGPDNVMMISQQHGNEPHGTEAVLNLIQNISKNGNAEFAQIREKLTVNIIVRVNPDGAIRERRDNVNPDVPDPYTFAQSIGWVDPDTGKIPTRLNNEKYGMYTYPGSGVDLNRFHFIDWKTSPMYRYWPNLFPENPGTEAAIVAQVVANMNPKPLWFVDLHEQGSNVTPDGKLVTFSLDTAHVTNQWDTDLQDERVQKSAKLLVVINDAAAQYGYAGVTRYAAPSAFEGRSRNQYLQKLGIPGILIEMRGQFQNLGIKSNGMITKNCYQNLFAILDATASGTLWDTDWTRVSEIPNGTPYWRELPNGDQGEDQE